MKIVVTGAAGMLAQALVPELRQRGHEVAALSRAELDVCDREAVGEVLGRENPDVVVQCAAYTAVDDAEADEAAAHRLNAESTASLAAWCHKQGALLVYPSTDYVFSGASARPYLPTDPVAPLGAYGRSKLAGERAAAGAGRHLTVRTSWLYGEGGTHFVGTISRLARERPALQVVADQVGRPTWTVSLSRVLGDLIQAGASGTFHATDGGEPTSWFGFAQQLIAEQGLGTPVEPVASDRFPRPAPRPRYSVLDCSSTEAVIGRPLEAWQHALRRYFAGPTQQG